MFSFCYMSIFTTYFSDYPYFKIFLFHFFTKESTWKEVKEYLHEILLYQFGLKVV